MVGSAYVTSMGFQPGDEFDIKVGRTSITLSAVAA
jgi:hypothetical protein